MFTKALSYIVLISCLLVACGGDAPNDSQETGTTEAELLQPTATPTDVPEPTMTPTPEPIQWARTYRGISGHDSTRYIQVTSDGGFVVAGSVGDGVIGSFNDDAWVMKLTPEGLAEWNVLFTLETINIPGNDNASAVQETSDGGYIVVITSQEFGLGRFTSGTLVAKLTSSGDIDWHIGFSRDCSGACLDYGYSIQETQDGGYALVGVTTTRGATSSGWLVKLTNQGLIQWQKVYGDQNNDDEAEFSDIRVTSDGGFIVTGRTGSFGFGEEDVWIMKLTSEGDIEWQKAIDGSDDDHASDILEASDGGFVMVGWTKSFGAGAGDAWATKLSSQGDIEWQKTFGGREFDYISSVQKTSDEGYILAGGTRSYGAGENDGWVIKLSSDGDAEWQRAFGGSEDDYFNSIQSTIDDGYIVAGATESFDVIGRDIWILKLNSEGEIPGFTGMVETNTSLVESDARIISTFATLSTGEFETFETKVRTESTITRSDTQFSTEE